MCSIDQLMNLCIKVSRKDNQKLQSNFYTFYLNKEISALIFIWKEVCNKKSNDGKLNKFNVLCSYWILKDNIASYDIKFSILSSVFFANN